MWTGAAHEKASFGAGRFLVEGRLGEGGMGVVYRARDRARESVVALKTLPRVDAVSLLRFKDEFRALADIAHPNVVRLYELLSSEDDWFFTMELLDGTDIVSYVTTASWPPPASGTQGARNGHGARNTAFAATVDARTAPTAASDENITAPVLEAIGARRIRGAEPEGPPARVATRVRDMDRLRATLRQLVEGVAAIHAAGKLHRDIKPSNVMVTRGGRVVLLDFGVVGDFAGDAAVAEDGIFGTPAYMAPEQASLRPATPASDWYAVGVVLFEALTGAIPFDGTPAQILLRKQAPLPWAPSDLAEGVPDDLDDLCVQLLRTDAAARPRARDILRRLEGDAPPSRRPGSAPPSHTFVGRAAQLRALDECFEVARKRRPVVAFVHGPSGMGKSSLLAQALDGLRARRDAVVFAGRCYERESLPFKGFDVIVDELARWMKRQPEGERVPLPPGMRELARIFPVLGGGRPVADGDYERDERGAESGRVEPHEVRRRAFAALKALLREIAKGRVLVLHVDDVQWSDVDSTHLMEELLASPDPVPMALVCTYRDELAVASPALATFLAAAPHFDPSTAVHHVAVGQLDEREAALLARTLMSAVAGPAADALARAIAKESQGNPFFVEELVRWEEERRMRGTARETPPGGPVSLEHVVLGRVAKLPAAARELLETIAVAGRPLEHRIAETAAGVEDEARAPAIALRNARLAQLRGLGDGDPIEPFHDRVREMLVSSMDAARRRARHAAIARAMLAHKRVDPEALLEHFLGAGDKDGARRWAVAAADAAAAGLAFLRAARLYAVAIDVGAGEPAALRRKMGDALANAGHGSEAADAYAAAGEGQGLDASESRRLAAEYYLKSGVVDRGLEVLRAVLRELDLDYPESKAAAFASLLWWHARLALRGRGFERRAAAAVPAEVLHRIDVAYSATVGLSLTDFVRASAYATRHLVLALDAGEPVRIVRALALDGATNGASAERSRDESLAVVRTAEELAASTGDPHGIGLARLASGLAYFFRGEWEPAFRALDEAGTLLRARCRAVSWEATNADLFACNALVLMGELAETARRVPGFMREASERRDRLSSLNVVYAAVCVHLAAGDVAAAAAVAKRGAYGEGAGRYLTGHWSALVGNVSIERYRGEGRAAWERMEREWPALERSFLLRVKLVDISARCERALCAIAAALEGHEPERLTRWAERTGARLAAADERWARGMGHYLLGLTSHLRGREDAAAQSLRRAHRELGGCGMKYVAAVAGHRLGQIVDGHEGRALVAAGRAYFAEQGFVDVEGVLRMSAPGRWA